MTLLARIRRVSMYTTRNFNTKRELKDAVAGGERVTVFAPGLGCPPENGTCAVEGPHYPRPHTWYAEVTLRDGVVIKVK
jgi:hypothetical protein